MRINIDNFSGTKGYDIDLRQKEVGGGRITIEQIDSIRQYPDAKSIIISGLEQKTFEYFISEYGNQFQSISFWKNKSVENLSMLSELEHIEFITYFFNQKVTKLWDMRKNKKLKGLQIDDFTRLHTIDEIEYAICHGFQPVSLGDSRLRTETAALFSVMLMNLNHSQDSQKRPL